MQWHEVVALVFLLLEYSLKLIAIGVVPENRQPSSSQAWLLLILMVPLVGFPLYFMIGSPYIHGRRRRVQEEVTRVISAHTEDLPRVPDGVEPGKSVRSVIAMNHRLTGLPCATGINEALYDSAEEFFAAIAREVDAAENYVHVEFYIAAWDETTDVLFAALARARKRGVRVRLLMDHLGSRSYPGWRQFKRRLTDDGIEWHLMLPLFPLRGRWRRPDLRNHRKLVVVDGRVGFLGSHNLIDPAYGSAKNARMGRRWLDLSLRISGQVIGQLEAVFATDWYIETGELPEVTLPEQAKTLEVIPGGPVNAMQIVTSGPGYPQEPNRQQFVQLMHLACQKLTVTSPYFVPDESLLTAMTGAAYRGVKVELFVGEESDQFIVGHAQRSYYRALLEAGVHIYLYPAPTVLHSKYFTIDDDVAVIGSSNMDYRSFALDYEVMLMGFGGDLVAALQRNDADYRAVSRELSLEEWSKQPGWKRWIDNVCRLTSAVM